VPFCDDCSKFWNPNSLPPDGTCPSCGRLIADAPPPQKIPWHFWLLLIAAGVYLGYRAIQGVGWLLSR